MSKPTVVTAIGRLVLMGFLTVYRRIKRIRTPLGIRVVQDSNAYEYHPPTGLGALGLGDLAPAIRVKQNVCKGWHRFRKKQPTRNRPGKRVTRCDSFEGQRASWTLNAMAERKERDVGKGGDRKSQSRAAIVKAPPTWQREWPSAKNDKSDAFEQLRPRRCWSLELRAGAVGYPDV
jgi:hypothetical protein